MNDNSIRIFNLDVIVESKDSLIVIRDYINLNLGIEIPINSIVCYPN